ncbi:DNA repair and recombination protein [Podosphaera aphanis]|nr:DNA repair and recombination protein [Podosphaera aphanis]
MNVPDRISAIKNVPSSPSLSTQDQIKLPREDGVSNEELQSTLVDPRVLADEATILKGLTEDVRDQADLERDITNQANLIIIEQEDERDQKRIDKVYTNIKKLQTQRRARKRRLDATTNNSAARNRLLRELEKTDTEISALVKDVADIQSRIDERHCHVLEKDEATGSSQRLPNESHRDFLIRTGKETPFSFLSEEASTDLEKRSHQNLRLPGFAEAAPVEEEFSLRPRKKRRLISNINSPEQQPKKSPDELEFKPVLNQDDVDTSDDDDDQSKDQRSQGRRKNVTEKLKKSEKYDPTGFDDGNEKMYQSRLKEWVERRSTARRQKLLGNDSSDQVGEAANNTDEKEWFKPCPDSPDHLFDNGIKLPGDIYPALFDYQRTGVQWLGELYSQQVGGIIGDEMGLGKTIQVISFLAALHYSKKLTKPVIVVAPATVLQQWVNEFHKWWPPMRVSILHSSGSGMANLRDAKDTEDEQEFYRVTDKNSSKKVKKIVDKVIQKGHVIITTYVGLQSYADVLIPVDWGYAVLDEGHKIRNPNTAITIHCKELRTPHRIILSGTPMQNNLIELWSLFDFIFPMKLGTLVSFRQAFETPIKQGGYANSTNLQILTATKCAETLKDAISPYLLQRLKVDVASDLPKKTEQVLLVKLTKPQREAYESFLASEEMSSILNRSRQSLYGIDILKKICNHPDLLEPNLKKDSRYRWANPNKSGKMKIVESLLNLWKVYGHKTLLFCQGVQMLDILENFLNDIGGFNYLRMDGSTNISQRQALVDRFNTESDLHVFLLTTKVGGLGVNLTGANRVIIFDPDWNPSTDIQARERAWRLGQKKEVTIYRLMTAGTIEEKMYHRQIFKQFLTNKILRDPNQRQTFQMKDLYDLFSLGTDENTTETAEMFKGTEVKFRSPSEESSLENKSQISTQPATTDVEEKNSESEVRNLNGVAGLEDYRGCPEENSTPEEIRLMEGIFAGSGIHSALEHDEIINGKKKIKADPRILEREAKKVAAEAAAQLRKAGETARKLTPGTVTWTGEYGSAGRPMNNLRGGSRTLGNIEASISLSGPTRRQDMKKLIRNFLTRHGGSVPSQILVNNFNYLCQTPDQVTEFKQVLAETARLEMDQRGRKRGRWYLKDCGV